MFWAELSHEKSQDHRDCGDSVPCVPCAFPCLGLGEQHLDFTPSTLLARDSVGEGGSMEKNPINNHVILLDKHLCDLTGKTGCCSSEAEDTEYCDE